MDQSDGRVHVFGATPSRLRGAELRRGLAARKASPLTARWILGAALLLAGCAAPPEAAAAPSAPTLAESTRTPAATIQPIPEGYRVQIARLGIDLPVLEGDVQRDINDQKTPEAFAFHLPGSAIPGRPGNAYLYAHARAGMFLSLWNARVGDEVRLRTPDGGVLSYAVTEVIPRVAPDDVSVAMPTPDERLTLQTSTGPAPANPRFVVIAKPIR